MEVFTVTKENVENLKDFFSETCLKNIDQEGFFTVGVYDDEGFVAGVMQFKVDSDQSSKCFGQLDYLYIHEDFEDSDASQTLIDELESILSASGIHDRFVQLPVGSDKKVFEFYRKLGFS